MTSQPSSQNIRERLVALTRDLILIPSIQSREEDRARCFDFIKNHLESLEHIELREFEHKTIPSLIAAPPGCHKPKILMCGHLDVIQHPDLSSYRSHIEDGRIYGPGAGDMKGAVAILLEVFRSIHSQIPNASLGLAITSDEEIGGECGVGYLFRDVGVRCSMAMIPDGGSLNKITVAEKGILHLRLSCQGKSAHAARPWLGENPIDKMMSSLNALRSSFQDYVQEGHYWYPTCSITVVGTENETTNRIASDAYAVIDVRFPNPETVSGMLTKIKNVIGSDMELEIIISAEPTTLSPDEDYQRIIEEVTGKPAEQIRDDGGSDARFISVYGIPVMISRPLVGNLHSKDEWIDIESMVQFYDIYEKYLLKKLKN